MLKKNGGLLAMILSIVGIVVWVTMFEDVMLGFDALWAIVGIEDLFMMPILLGYGPTIILLAVIGGMAVAYYAGAKSLAVKDTNGLIRMVMAALSLVVFITMFSEVATVFVGLFTLYDADPNYPIFGLTCSIAPAILFLGGIVAIVGTGVSGARARLRA